MSSPPFCRTRARTHTHFCLALTRFSTLVRPFCKKMNSPIYVLPSPSPGLFPLSHTLSHSLSLFLILSLSLPPYTRSSLAHAPSPHMTLLHAQYVPLLPPFSLPFLPLSLSASLSPPLSSHVNVRVHVCAMSASYPGQLKT